MKSDMKRLSLFDTFTMSENLIRNKEKNTTNVWDVSSGKEHMHLTCELLLKHRRDACAFFHLNSSHRRLAQMQNQRALRFLFSNNH